MSRIPNTGRNCPFKFAPSQDPNLDRIFLHDIFPWGLWSCGHKKKSSLLLVSAVEKYGCSPTSENIIGTVEQEHKRSEVLFLMEYLVFIE
jgi:hypothetical protein